jgi:hypothetical protein
MNVTGSTLPGSSFTQVIALPTSTAPGKQTLRRLTAVKQEMLLKVKTISQNEYACKTTDEPLPKRQKRDYSPDAIEKHLFATYDSSTTTAADDFDAFIGGARVDPKDVPNIVAWWEHQISDSLWQYALDVLSIPAMSTECERLFSSAVDLVGTTRFRLQDETMERLELVRQ